MPAREIFSSAWQSETRAPFAAFREWTQRYLAAPAVARGALLAEGGTLATARRAELAAMIRTDPRQALAEAVPISVRTRLPQEITDLLEARVAGQGGIALEGVLGAPGATVAEPNFRSAMVNGQEYRAYTYGRRVAQTTKVDISVLGIAVGGALAVSESPVRVLEAGETPAAGTAVSAVCPISGLSTPVTQNTPLNIAAPVAVEIAGKVQVLCHVEHVPLYESRLINAETAAGPYSGALTAELTQADGSPGTSGVAQRPPLAWSTGIKKVLVIRVDFSDKPGTPTYPYAPHAVIDPAYVAGVFNQANQLADFYAQSSFGQTALSLTTADVTDVLRMPRTASYYAVGDGNSAYNSALHSDAQTLANGAGFNLASYDRIGVVFANLSSDLGGIAGSHITYGGLGDVVGSRFWINGFFDFRDCGHEIGHTYGAQHCNLWQVNDGNPVSGAGSSLEYGDPFGIMSSGNTDSRFHFDMWEKSILHWIPDPSVTTVSAPGTWRVYRFDHGSANTANSLALKIVRNSTQDYWIGLRQLFTSNSSLMNGAYILWGYNTSVQGNLLDFTTPGSNPQDAALAVGSSFHDTTAGITIHPLAKGGTTPSEYLDVQVDFDPRIQWQVLAATVDQQLGSATLTLTRTANATGAVTVSYATADGTATAPANYTARSGTVTWASGDSAAKTITIPINPAAAFTGLLNFSVTLSNITGGVIANGATATVNIASPGTGDPAFHEDFVNNSVLRTLAQPDGKILIGGWFTLLEDASYVTYTRNGFARLNANGSVDSSFGSGAGLNSRPVYAMALQPDGKVLIGGSFTTVHGAIRNRVARLNADGSLDTTFDPGAGPGAVVRALVLQPDGKILLGGDFTTCAGAAREYVARLNADGSLDTGFVGPDFGGYSGWRVYALALQPDNRLLVGGYFYFQGGAFAGSKFRGGIIRTNANGSVDTTFDPGDGAHVDGNTGSVKTVEAIAVQRDGLIVIGGDFTAVSGVTHNRVARLTTAGALDSAFAPSIDGTVEALLIPADGKIVLAGNFTTVNGTTLNHFARLTAGGATDTAFNVGTGTSTEAHDLALQPDGEILLSTDYGTIQGVSGITVGRLFSGVPGLAGSIRLTAPAVIAAEGNALTVTARRNGGSYGAISINYGTQAGTAAASRYTPVAGTLSWADGDAADKSFTMPILNDHIAEPDQTFTLALGIPIGGTTVGVPGLSTVTVTTGFDAWRYSHFNSGELGSAAISGETADPNGNGFPNLLDYAFGMDPKLVGIANAPVPGQQTVSGSNYLTLTVHRVPGAADLTYTPQSGPALGTWTGAPVQLGQPVTNSDGTQTVIWIDNVPLTPGAPQRYLRLQVTRQP